MDFQPLHDAILEFQDERVVQQVQAALDAGVAPKEIILSGLAKGMLLVGEKYERKEYFAAEMLRASRAFNKGMAILSPLIQQNGENSVGKVVLGLVKGNTQDNGKNIVKIFLEANNFTVVDLGKNVPSAKFMAEAEANQADLIGISIMTTSGVIQAREVLTSLADQGIRGKYKVFIGGASANPEIAKRIGADGYAPDAGEAVTLARALVGH